MKKWPSSARRGFTLIEMSIVIAIIALIIGGIVVSKSLIGASQLQSVISDVNRYKQAASNFRDKYHYLPGDMPIATTYWTTGTANGNGDGFIGGQSPDPTNITTPSELLLAWQHLSFAHLIEGQYSGVGLSSYIPGTNVPASRVPKAGYALFYLYTGSGYTYVFPGIYNHVIAFGQPELTGLGTVTDWPTLTSTDAWTLDSKIDDGLPGTGNVRTYVYTAASKYSYCATTNDPTTAVYAISNTGTGNGANCSLLFITGF